MARMGNFFVIKAGPQHNNTPPPCTFNKLPVEIQSLIFPHTIESVFVDGDGVPEIKNKSCLEKFVSAAASTADKTGHIVAYSASHPLDALARCYYSFFPGTRPWFPKRRPYSKYIEACRTLLDIDRATRAIATRELLAFQSCFREAIAELERQAALADDEYGEKALILLELMTVRRKYLAYLYVHGRIAVSGGVWESGQ